MRRPHRPSTLALPVLALVALASSGCLRDPDPIDLDEDALAVHAVIEAGADSVVLVISRPVEPPREHGPWNAYRGVSGAEVRLIHGTDTTWVTETPDIPCVNAAYAPDEPGAGKGCYRAQLDAPLAAGARYGLEIRLPDGTRVTGETTTPEAIVLRSPDPGLRLTARCHDPYDCYGEYTDTPPYVVPVATIPVAWTAPESVARVGMALLPVVVYLDGTSYPGEGCVLGRLHGDTGFTRDTTSWRVANITCAFGGEPALEPARFDSIRARLSVMGWNEDYSEYIENGSGRGIRVEAASRGLDGAFGVFGAISRSVREVVLIRDPAPGSGIGG